MALLADLLLGLFVLVREGWCPIYVTSLEPYLYWQSCSVHSVFSFADDAKIMKVMRCYWHVSSLLCSFYTCVYIGTNILHDLPFCLWRNSTFKCRHRNWSNGSFRPNWWRYIQEREHVFYKQYIKLMFSTILLCFVLINEVPSLFTVCLCVNNGW